MITVVRSTGIVFLAMAVAFAAIAQEPESGHVLLLKNERILQGDIERHGTQYRLRRDIGETWVDQGKVLCLCADVVEAYQFLRKAANLRDPDERMRLARWCYAHNLKDRAIEEAEAVLHYRPQDEAAARLVHGLKRPDREPIEPASAQVTPATKIAPVELPAEAMAMFASKVQPILMNTCLSCHVSPDSGFRLMRAQGMANRRALQSNVSAAMQFVRRGEDWANSPLLVKAITAHGGTPSAPIKSRTSQPYKTLEEWVKLAAEGPVSEVKETVKPAEPLPGQPVGTPSNPLPSLEPKPVPLPAKAPEKDAPKDAPPPKPQVPDDPYDPELFNGQPAK